MIELLKGINIFVVSQIEDIVPADKILYNLRDLTGAIDNYGLRASSIQQQKNLVSQAHMFIWMLNMGKETFCQTYQQAKQLVKYLK